MEKYAYLNDIPLDLEITDDDVLVIGKQVIVEDEVRHHAKSVKAGEYKKSMVKLVLDTADLPSHQTAMEAEVSKAGENATTATEQASIATNKATIATEQAQEATEQAQEATRQAGMADNSVNTAANHVNTCESLKDKTNQLNISAAQSKESAADSATQADANAGYFATAISLMVNNSYHLVKNHPLM